MNSPTDKSNGGNGQPAPGNTATQGNVSKNAVPGVSPTQKVDEGDVKPQAKSSKPDTDEGTANQSASTGAKIGEANTAAAAQQAQKEREFEEALAAKDNELSVDQQKMLDNAMGDHSEADDEMEEVIKDARDRHQNDDRNIHRRLDGFIAGYESPVAVITKLVRDIPIDTPDDFILYGAAGHKLRMGHLRALVMGK